MSADIDAGEIEKTTNRASTRKLKPGLMADRLSFRVRGLLSLLGERVIEAFAPFGLRSGSFTSMALIAANPGCSQIELAREGGLDKSLLVGILNDLEKFGYAIRTRSPKDKRRSNLYLTPEGEKVMLKMYDAAMGPEKSLREAFTQTEMQTLFMLLERAYFVLANEDRNQA
jgi:DNA-binding MarR family transcriptional regulator